MCRSAGIAGVQASRWSVRTNACALMTGGWKHRMNHRIYEHLEHIIGQADGILDLLDVFARADNLADFFTSSFRHSGTKQIRVREQLRPLVLLHLFAEGISTGIKRIAQANHIHKYDELLYVRQNYFSPEAFLVEKTIEKEHLINRLSVEDLRALLPLFYEHINPYGVFEIDANRPSFLQKEAI